MISLYIHLTMIPGFGRTGFGRDQIYPDTSVMFHISDGRMAGGMG